MVNLSLFLVMSTQIQPKTGNSATFNPSNLSQHLKLKTSSLRKEKDF
jgi:hypothetical protein